MRRDSQVEASEGGHRRRLRWESWGVGAGLLGLVANVLADDQASLSAAERSSGVAVVEQLDRAQYHVGVIAGMLAVFFLVMFASGWRRWAATESRLDLAAAGVATALTASAAALLVGYGFKGGLAEYLEGGINDDNFPNEGLYVLFVINDTAPWFGWFGVIFAAALCAWLGIRQRAVPLWIGIVSGLAALVPVGIMLASGAVAIAGLVGPLWLLVASGALALRGHSTH